jgi:hypothetical protein
MDMMQALRAARLFSCGMIIVLMGCVSPQASAQQCPAEMDRAQLRLDYESFDAAGWRELLARGCVDAALALLESYRSTNNTHLTEEQKLELAFHLGQALAFSGRDQDSIRYFEQARGGTEEWAAYVEATLAFLRHDVAGLAAQRARYLRAPGASDMRVRVIDGFAQCIDSPYAQAAMCAMTH